MANKKVSVGLSKQSLEKLKGDLESLQKKIQQLPAKIVDDASEYCLNEMQKNYAESIVEAGTEMSFAKTGTETKKKVSMIGAQAIYHEYGTGTVGEMNPHPRKEGKGLKGYNTGETIRPVTPQVADKTGFTEGSLYWTYRDQGGNWKATQGIASQKVVFNSGEATKKHLKKIIQKSTKEVLETFE